MPIFSFLKRRSDHDTGTGAKHSDARETSGEPRPEIRCSFCGKNQDEVRKIIAGPTVYICDECIDLCNDIIEEEVDQQGTERNSSQASPAESSNTSGEVVCYGCAELRHPSELIFTVHDATMCVQCRDRIWEYIQACRATRFRLEQTGGLLPCIICREIYLEAELYEPIEA